MKIFRENENESFLTFTCIIFVISVFEVISILGEFKYLHLTTIFQSQIYYFLEETFELIIFRRIQQIY